MKLYLRSYCSCLPNQIGWLGIVGIYGAVIGLVEVVVTTTVAFLILVTLQDIKMLKLFF